VSCTSKLSSAVLGYHQDFDITSFTRGHGICFGDVCASIKLQGPGFSTSQTCMVQRKNSHDIVQDILVAAAVVVITGDDLSAATDHGCSDFSMACEVSLGKIFQN
jgi:hypothetical protein